MSDYPILVAHFSDGQEFQLACDGCEHVWRATDVDEFIRAIDTGACGVCGGFRVVPAYDEAPECPNCGVLGYHESILRGCCSRACMLQLEYAEQRGG
jgi:hypothetical protein